MIEKQTKDFAVAGHESDVVVGACAGCEEEPVVAGQQCCALCDLIHEELLLREKKRFAVDRVNTGIVEFEETETEGPASAWAVGMIFFGTFCTAMLTMTAFWLGFRWLIGFALRHGG